MNDPERLRIGFVISSVGLLPGGLETTAAGLAAGLVERGYSVTIVTGGHVRNAPGLGLDLESLRWIRVPCLPADRRAWQRIAARRPAAPIKTQSLTFVGGCLFRPEVHRLIASADVTITALEIETALVSRWRERFGRPNVSLFPGVVDPTWITRDRSAVRLAVSHAVARRAGKRGLRVDGVVLSGGPASWLETPYTPKAAVRTLLYVGRLEENKGALDLVPILAALRAEFPDLSLRIVGDGPLRTELGRLAERAGLSGRVAFLGPLSHREVRGELENADLFVFPSRYESFSQALLEAAAVGVPVVAADVEGNREALGDAARLLPTGDIGSWSGAIRGLIGNLPERQRMSIDGRERARDFTPARATTRLLPYLELALARRTAGNAAAPARRESR